MGGIIRLGLFPSTIRCFSKGYNLKLFSHVQPKKPQIGTIVFKKHFGNKDVLKNKNSFNSQCLNNKADYALNNKLKNDLKINLTKRLFSTSRSSKIVASEILPPPGTKHPRRANLGYRILRFLGIILLCIVATRIVMSVLGASYSWWIRSYVYEAASKDPSEGGLGTLNMYRNESNDNSKIVWPKEAISAYLESRVLEWYSNEPGFAATATIRCIEILRDEAEASDKEAESTSVILPSMSEKEIEEITDKATRRKARKDSTLRRNSKVGIRIHSPVVQVMNGIRDSFPDKGEEFWANKSEGYIRGLCDMHVQLAALVANAGNDRAALANLYEALDKLPYGPNPAYESLGCEIMGRLLMKDYKNNMNNETLFKSVHKYLTRGVEAVSTIRMKENPELDNLIDIRKYIIPSPDELSYSEMAEITPRLVCAVRELGAFYTRIGKAEKGLPLLLSSLRAIHELSGSVYRPEFNVARVHVPTSAYEGTLLGLRDAEDGILREYIAETLWALENRNLGFAWMNGGVESMRMRMPRFTCTSARFYKHMLESSACMLEKWALLDDKKYGRKKNKLNGDMKRSLAEEYRYEADSVNLYPVPEDVGNRHFFRNVDFQFLRLFKVQSRLYVKGYLYM